MLDDLGRVKRFDRYDMLSKLNSIPEQMTESRDLVRDIKRVKDAGSVVVAGMGHSGLVGDIFDDWLSAQLDIPIVSCKGFSLPGLVDERTFLLVISYSGNTDETLSCLKDGMKRTKNIVCIGSGGKLEVVCMKNKLALAKVPPGYPPRTALGYLFGTAAHALDAAGIYKAGGEVKEAAEHVAAMRESVGMDSETSSNPAKKMALELRDRTPIIYAYHGYRSCATRWQIMIHENPKKLSWSGMVPEMFHNEVMGWAGDENPGRFAMIFLRSGEPESIRKRIEHIKATAKCPAMDVKAEGREKLARMFHLMYVGDYVSYYMALAKGVDPTPVDAIEDLKKVGI